MPAHAYSLEEYFGIEEMSSIRTGVRDRGCAAAPLEELTTITHSCNLPAVLIR